MSEQNKRQNFYNIQHLTVDDLKKEQTYNLKNYETLRNAIGNGSLDKNGLRVTLDTVAVEPIALDNLVVAIPSTDDQNVHWFHSTINTISDAPVSITEGYTVFKTESNNIQKISLRMQIADQDPSNNATLRVEIRPLIDSSDALSIPKSNAIFTKTLSQVEIPSTESEELLVIDCSNIDNHQGVTLSKNSYYALYFTFASTNNSLRVFHSPLRDAEDIDQHLHSYFLVNDAFQQGTLGEDGEVELYTIYHKLETASVKVSAGEAFVNGKLVKLPNDQRFIDLVDLRQFDENTGTGLNYVTISYKEEAVDLKTVKRTQNLIASSIEERAELNVFNKSDWDQLKANNEDSNYMLLALVSDLNVLSLDQKFDVSLSKPAEHLAYHDWVNPSNKNANTEANNLRTLYPNGFVFYLANVPTNIPLYDDNSNLILETEDIFDSNGNVIRQKGDIIKETIDKVTLLVYLNNGTVVRSFEMTPLGSIASGNNVFRDYAGIFDLENNPNAPIPSFKVDPAEVDANTQYNFAAYTSRGKPVYIQDYNRAVVVEGQDGFSSLREKVFTVDLQRDQLTAVLDEDLKLGEIRPEGPPSEDGSIDVIEKRAQQILGESAKPIGNIDLAGGIIPRSDTVLPYTIESPIIHVLGDIDGDGYVTQNDVDLAQREKDYPGTLNKLQLLKALVSRTGIKNEASEFFVTNDDINELQEYVNGSRKIFSGSTLTNLTFTGLKTVTYVDTHRLGNVSIPVDDTITIDDVTLFSNWLRGVMDGYEPTSLSIEQLLRLEVTGNTTIPTGDQEIIVNGVTYEITPHSVVDGNDYQTLVEASHAGPGYKFAIESQLTRFIGQPYLFGPTPMAHEGQRLPNDSVLIEEAYQTISGSGSFRIEVDTGSGPTDITFSGSTDRDQGGNGNEFLVYFHVSDLSLLEGKRGEIKLRNSDLRNNTKLGSTATIRQSDAGGTVTGMGHGAGSNAGFKDGDKVYLYIDDQQAFYRDNGIDTPITVDYSVTTSSYSISNPVNFLGPKKFFGEMSYYDSITQKWLPSIKSITDFDPRIGPPKGTVAISTDPNGTTGSGQLYFNYNNTPPSNAVVVIRYNEYKESIFDVEYWSVRNKPLATYTGQLVSNTNDTNILDGEISVTEASNLDASSSTFASVYPFVKIFIDGVDVTSEDILSIAPPFGISDGYELVREPYKLVADVGILKSGEIAVNPEKGQVRFYKKIDRFGKELSEGPNKDQTLKIDYYTAKYSFKNNPTQGIVTYDVAYDFDNNGRIDEADLTLLMSKIGKTVSPGDEDSIFDLNGDSVIDELDVDLFAERFGSVQSGVPDYGGAAVSRLSSILVYKEGEAPKRIKVVRALSKKSTATKRGKTVLFFDKETPVIEPGRYIIQFGFSNELSIGEVAGQFKTVDPLPTQLDLAAIKLIDPTTQDIHTVTSLNTTIDDNGRYNHHIYFYPPVKESMTLRLLSEWNSDNIGIYGKKTLVTPLTYEEKQRRQFGPFKTSYSEGDYKYDGTGITVRLEDVSKYGGDETKTEHLFGVPLENLRFSVILYAKTSDNSEARAWVWNGIVYDPISKGLQIENNDSLYIDHRTQGRNGEPVLTPFGLNKHQVKLMPKHAGGDIEDDLSNIVVVREDLINDYVAQHNHKDDRSGGVLTSNDIKFTDPRALLRSGNMTEIVYQLLDDISTLRSRVAEISRVNTLRWDNPLLSWDSGIFWDSIE